jgi:hypothetical protein
MTRMPEVMDKVVMMPISTSMDKVSVMAWAGGRALIGVDMNG